MNIEVNKFIFTLSFQHWHAFILHCIKRGTLWINSAFLTPACGDIYSRGIFNLKNVSYVCVAEN